MFPEGSSLDFAGAFVYEGRTVTLIPAKGAGMTIEGQPVDTSVELNSGEDTQEISLGRLTFFVIERGGRHAIRLRDPESPAVAGSVVSISTRSMKAGCSRAVSCPTTNRVRSPSRP